MEYREFTSSYTHPSSVDSTTHTTGTASRKRKQRETEDVDTQFARFLKCCNEVSRLDQIVNSKYDQWRASCVNADPPLIPAVDAQASIRDTSVQGFLARSQAYEESARRMAEWREWMEKRDAYRTNELQPLARELVARYARDGVTPATTAAQTQDLKGDDAAIAEEEEEEGQMKTGDGDQESESGVVTSDIMALIGGFSDTMAIAERLQKQVGLRDSKRLRPTPPASPHLSQRD
eukprot:TRINITY_DN11621_c0_g1_i1.p1 TRINITY_DN11621_c0_g1~~TRINITY_DN11621_c0_g1_i1.p1  ORF type:complete len:234 (-),score=54.25 TRINITY_DN11621_c0_g1_i1:110-811(-)